MAACSGKVPYTPYDPATRTALNENEIPYTFARENVFKNPLSFPFDAGDPFIMRWNGKYYLVPSTHSYGIKMYESDDMVNWIDKGWVVTGTDDPPPSDDYYAPEIIYYKGSFYLCTSPKGDGHYFYKSTTDSPLGPYVCISGNLGRGIDGAFYLRDDGRLFLLHTGVRQ
jgi:beta-xylosidase